MEQPALRTALQDALQEVLAERGRLEKRIDAVDTELSNLFEAYKKTHTAEGAIRELLGEEPETPQQPLQAPPTATLASNGKYPKTIDAVYDILRDNEGRRMTATRLQEILEAEGKLRPDLKQPYGVVLEAAKRLSARSPEIVASKRKGKIFFSFRSQGRKEAN